MNENPNNLGHHMGPLRAFAMKRLATLASAHICDHLRGSDYSINSCVLARMQWKGRGEMPHLVAKCYQKLI